MSAGSINLKHANGDIGHFFMAIKGPILELKKADGEIPLGSSGIQIRLEVDRVLEGFRPGRVVRIRPGEAVEIWGAKNHLKCF